MVEETQQQAQEASETQGAQEVKEPGSTIPELSKEDEYPAQGAYVGHLLTDFLNSRVTSTVTDVTYEDGILWYSVAMNQYDEDREVVGYLNLAVSFHRGTIALLCPTEAWWEVMQETVIFNRLWSIAEHTGCLIGLSAVDTGAARVWDPAISKELEGKFVFPAPSSLN
jgi:hypothetical protein